MKIKLEKQEKLDLIVGGKVYVVGTLYQFVAGSDKGQAYTLDRIYFDNKANAYFFNLGGEHFINSELHVYQTGYQTNRGQRFIN